MTLGSDSWRVALAFERDPLRTLQRLAAGSAVFALRSLTAGPMLVIGEPALAHQLLHAPPDRFRVGAANWRILPVLPKGTVLTLDGPAHRARRRQLAPFFAGERFDRLSGQIGALIARELDRWPVGRPVALLPRLRSLTFSVAAALLLDIRDRPRRTALERCLSAAVSPYALLASHRSLRCLRAAGPQAAATRGRRTFAACLTRLLDGRLPPFGADETLALLLAGRDTTATALAWALLELARAPALLETLGVQADGGGSALLDAVIHETLRMWPPLIDIVREAAGTVDLAGWQASAGTLVMVSPLLLGRSAAYTQPERFHPQRFLPKRPDPHVWVPFGGGPHRCLGAPLAMLELREILPRVARRFRLSATPGAIERPRLYGTAMVPSQGAMIVLARR